MKGIIKNKHVAILISLLLAFALLLSVVFINFNSSNNNVAYAQATYEYANDNDGRTLVPNATISSNMKECWRQGLDHRKSAMLIKNWEVNTLLDLTKFGSTVPDYTVIKCPNMTSETNKLLYDTKLCKNNGAYQYWQYMYGLLELPIELQKYGGSISMQATVNTCTGKDDNIEYQLSLVAGDALLGKDLKDKDGINPNKPDFWETNLRQNTANGVSLNGLKNSSTDNIESKYATARDISINILPGEKYIRLSFIVLADDKGGTSGKNFYQQELSNVKVTNYTVADHDPVITVKNADQLAVDSLDVKVNVEEYYMDENTGITVDDQPYVRDENGDITINFTDTTAKALKVTDKNGKITTKSIAPTCLITLGDGVTIVNQDNILKHELTVKIVASEGNKVATPEGIWSGVTATKIYNYGVEAQYKVLFDKLVNCNQKLEPTLEAIKVNVIVNTNGNIVNNTFDWKSAQSIVVPNVEGKTFLGIYNEKGTLVASEKDLSKSAGNIGVYNFVVTTPATFNVKYVEEAGKTLITYKNLAGRTINQVLIEGDFDPLANTELAPTMPYMIFKGWKLQANNVAVPEYTYNSEVVFNVTVDGLAVENAHFNKRIDLEGSEFGWEINGKLVTISSNYSVFVTNDMVITKAQQAQELAPVKEVTVNKDGAIHVINGLLEDGAKYKEVGFIIADNTLDDNYFKIENTNYVTKCPVYTITNNSNQFVLAVSGLTNDKVKMYTIDEAGNITYSDVAVVLE